MDGDLLALMGVIATGLLVFIQAFFLGGSKVMIKAGEPKVQEAEI